MTPSFADLPIGFGRTKKFAYTTSVTSSIDFVMDVNGFKGPNSEARNGKQYDIRSFRVARFSDGCPGSKINSLGCVYKLPSFSSLQIGTEDIEKYDPNWKKGYYANRSNGWAGAKKACDDLGMSLPSKSRLESLYNYSKNNPESGLPTSRLYWSSTEKNNTCAWYINFSTGEASSMLCKDMGAGTINAICVDD